MTADTYNQSCYGEEVIPVDDRGMSQHAPRVSILIPNYNNGQSSSLEGETDLIGVLLQSLHDTLHDDPTPLEIIAYDDGSTDESLDVLRDWSEKSWRNGKRFLKLIEAEHTGVLSIGANRLVRESTGEILVRLDGDTQMLTARWASLLCQVFDQGPPRLGVVGPKQLRLDGKIHAFGDWILHPKGYHHNEAAADRHSVTKAAEVDHVMGCFYCCKRAVYDEVGGFDENILRGQTIDFGIAARLKGWSCWAIPQIEYLHRHGQRGARDTKADTREGVKKTLDAFKAKWGFSRLSPDLDVVLEKYRGTPLLWNAEVFGTPPGPKMTTSKNSTLSIEQSEWSRYSQEPAFKQATDLRIMIALQVISQIDKPNKIAVLGGGAGLSTHLLSGQGHKCVATDPDQAKITLARQCVKSQTYPHGKPEFFHQPDPRKLPLPDGSVDLALLYDQIETYDNPTALLQETHRVLSANGTLVVVTKRPSQALNPQEARRCYRPEELLVQVDAIEGLKPTSDPKTMADESIPLILVAKRVGLETGVEKPATSSPSQTPAEPKVEARLKGKAKVA